MKHRKQQREVGARGAELKSVRNPSGGEIARPQAFALAVRQRAVACACAGRRRREWKGYESQTEKGAQCEKWARDRGASGGTGPLGS
jgi:hypothetical protein